MNLRHDDVYWLAAVVTGWQPQPWHREPLITMRIRFHTCGNNFSAKRENLHCEIKLMLEALCCWSDWYQYCICCLHSDCKDHNFSSLNKLSPFRNLFIHPDIDFGKFERIRAKPEMKFKMWEERLLQKETIPHLRERDAKIEVNCVQVKAHVV